MYPDEKFLIECCKTEFFYFQLRRFDFKLIKRILVPVIRAVDERLVDHFNYPILKND
jgi:hypothetical protein